LSASITGELQFLQHRSRYRAHAGVVLDQQDRAIAARDLRRFRAGHLGRLNRRIAARQIQHHARAAIRRALDLHVPA
jgi:hypothetical protein